MGPLTVSLTLSNNDVHVCMFYDISLSLSPGGFEMVHINH